MMYDKKAKGGDAGCVKAWSEEKYAMLDNGGKKYSKGNNPAEMKAKADKLAKAVK